jgi:hypothetical protein
MATDQATMEKSLPVRPSSALATKNALRLSLEIVNEIIPPQFDMRGADSMHLRGVALDLVFSKLVETPSP